MKKLKHSSKRWLALLMALMMCLSVVTMTGFADNENADQGDGQEQNGGLGDDENGEPEDGENGEPEDDENDEPEDGENDEPEDGENDEPEDGENGEPEDGENGDQKDDENGEPEDGENGEPKDGENGEPKEEESEEEESEEEESEEPDSVFMLAGMNDLGTTISFSAPCVCGLCSSEEGCACDDVTNGEDTPWGGEICTCWYDAANRKEEYTLYNGAQLAGLAQLVNNDGVTFTKQTIELGADINLGYVQWEPIGAKTPNRPFMGTFDGQGKTISNLKVVKDVKDEGDAGGLFGYTSYAGITHFTLENVDVTAGADVGAAIGVGSFFTELSQITVTGDISIHGYTRVGGVIGKFWYSNMKSCEVDGDGTGTILADERGVGGITGNIAEEGQVVYGCKVSGVSISGQGRVGGISGNVSGPTCIVECTVSGIRVTTSETSYGVGTGGMIAGANMSTAKFAAQLINNHVDPDGNTSSLSVAGVSYKAPLPQLGENGKNGEGVKAYGAIIAQGVKWTQNKETKDIVGRITALNGGTINIVGELAGETDFSNEFASGVISETGTTTEDGALTVTDGKITLTPYVAEVGGQKYATLTEAVAEAAKLTNPTVKLLKDIDLGNALLSIAPKTILDLNGQVLSGGATTCLFVPAGGDLTIQDTKGNGKISSSTFYGVYARGTGNITIKSGTIEGTLAAVYVEEDATSTVTVEGGNLIGLGTAKGYDSYAIKAAGGKTLELKGGSLTAKEPTNKDGKDVLAYGINATSGEVKVSGCEIESDNYGIAVFGKVSLTVTSGTIHSKSAFAITSNGSHPKYDGTEITISGGTITSDNAAALYLPSYDGVTEINGGTITGGNSGIEIRAGQLTVNSGSITATKSPTTAGPNGSGSTTVGAGIAISQHSTCDDIHVIIEGGTIKGDSALSVAAPETGPTVKYPGKLAPDFELDIRGGDFIGESEVIKLIDGVQIADAGGGEAKDLTGFVSGGSFSESIADTGWLSDGLNAELQKSTGEATFSYHKTMEEAYDAAADDSKATVTDLSTAAEDVEKVTVTLDAGEGSVAPSKIVVVKDSPIGTLPTPTRSGFSFNGWFVGDVQYTSESRVSDDVTLTASWTRNPTGGSAGGYDYGSGELGATSGPGAGGGTAGSGSTTPGTSAPIIPAPIGFTPSTPAQDAPAGNEPAQNAPAGNEPAQNAPAGNEPAQNAPAVNEPAQDAPAVNEPAQNAPAVNEPAQNAPAVNEPAQNAPAGDATVVDIPDTDTPLTGAPAGDDSLLDIADGDVPLSSGLSAETASESGNNTVLWICIAVAGCGIVGLAAWLVLKKRVRS